MIAAKSVESCDDFATDIDFSIACIYEHVVCFAYLPGHALFISSVPHRFMIRACISIHCACSPRVIYFGSLNFFPVQCGEYCSIYLYSNCISSCAGGNVDCASVKCSDVNTITFWVSFRVWTWYRRVRRVGRIGRCDTGCECG